VPVGEFDIDLDGRIDGDLVIFGPNGYGNRFETDDESGIPVFAVADTDNDGVKDFRDLDSDGDGFNDIVEAGASDNDSDGMIDNGVDANTDGLYDGIVNSLFSDGQLTDVDGDFLADFQDVDANGSDSNVGNGGDTVTPGGDTPTDPADPLTPIDSGTPVSNNGALIQTGLQGAAGCSVLGNGKDGLLPGLALVSFLLMITRRRKLAVAKQKRD